MLTSCSGSVLLLWFVQRRGLVSGVRGVFIFIGLSLGPAAFSLGLDHFGSYNAAVKICLFLLVLLLMAALWVRQEEVVHA